MYQSCSRPFSSAGALHELPDAFGLGPRQGARLERTLNQRHISQIQRKAFGPEDLLDHRQILGAAAQAVLEVALQSTAEQLDVLENLGVLRDVDVVKRLLQIGRDGLLCFFGCRRLLERGDGQEVVDGRRLIFLFGEAITLSQRGYLVGADPFNQPVEVLANTRHRPPTVTRLQQHLEGAVELGFGHLEMTLAQFALARFEVRGRQGDELGDRVVVC